MTLQFYSDKTLGACGALCLWRGTINAHRGRHVGTSGGPGLGYRQFFPQHRVALHPRLTQAPSKRLAPGTWQQRQDPVITPTPALGAPTGAPSKDILGTVLSAFVLREARSEHMQEQLSSPFAQRSVCDEWFDEDEQVVVRPALSNSWLRVVDAARSTIGATRDTVGKGDVAPFHAALLRSWE